MLDVMIVLVYSTIVLIVLLKLEELELHNVLAHPGI
jgi:hypothetical protein